MHSIVRRTLPAAAIEMAAARLHSMVSDVPVVEEAWAAAAECSVGFAELANTADIDAGEAQLFVILEALGDPGVLVTGDKRFLNALKANFSERHAAVAERLLSLEGCLCAVCETRGVDYVVARVLPVAVCDGSMRLALGCHQGSDHTAFLQALRSCDPCRR